MAQLINSFASGQKVSRRCILFQNADFGASTEYGFFKDQGAQECPFEGNQTRERVRGFFIGIGRGGR